ncbi:MAG: lantibiotic dehydratase [Pseudonocardiaceae bacterium]
MRDRGRWYRQVDAALLRATVRGSDVVPALWPDLDDVAGVEQWCAWLDEVWSHVPVAEAIAVASPALADRVEAVRRGLRPGAGQVRRVVMSVARYLVRMRGRATPFGAFAGVAPLRFGTSVSARWSDDHEARTRADAVWLAGVIARLEACPELRCRLTVVLNDLAVVRGERLVVPWQPHASDPNRDAVVEVSVRRSPLVQMITHLARSAVPVSDLIDKLHAEFPTAAVAAIDVVVTELMTRGVLISSLRPPSTSTDGLAHVVHRLRDIDADSVEQAAPLVAELGAIHTELQAADHVPSWVDGQARRAAASRMRALSSAAEPTAAGQPLMVDLRLDAAMVLPRQVATEAEWAASALLRLSPAPAGKPGWREYHARFLNRYGSGAVVPLDQLVDPITGPGFPSHYSDLGPPAAAVSRREERLLALAQRAALDGAREVVLDDGALDALAADSGEDVRSAQHVDVCVEIRAPTTAALAEGAFTLAVTGIGRTAIATSGRFLDVLPEDDRQRMLRHYGELPVAVGGALAAQLCFPPQHPRVENVARVPLVLPELLCLGEHHDGAQRRIPLRDLAVTADPDRMYVVSLPRRQVVEPVLAHALARHTMPALARLLFELPRATSTAVSLFDWGAAACLPYRPRVRYRRSILSAARWRLSPAELPGPAASPREWAAALTAVRERLDLPADVYVGTADRRLRLHLDDPLDVALLRAHLDEAADTVTVMEAPTAADHGWIDGRAHEVVIPLASTAAPASAPAVVTRPGPLPLIERGHGAMPGSHVLYATLACHPDVVDTILTGHLSALLAGWDDPPLWWFVRYRSPAPHLRLRLHCRQDYGRAAVRVGAWAAELRRRGLAGDLALCTYEPETARYGSGAVMAAAEALFAADSVAVLAQLTALSARPKEAGGRVVHPQALTAVSLVDLVCAVTGSRQAGMRWLVDHPELAGHARVDRDVQRQALDLAGVNVGSSIRSGSSTLSSIPGGARISSAWQARRVAATRYAELLTVEDTHVRPASVAVSLLHLHHVRAHGIDPDTEALTHRLARGLALAATASRTTSEGTR